MAENNNGKLSVSDRLGRIENTLEKIDDRLDKYFGVNGFCAKQVNQINLNTEGIKGLKKWQWFIATIIVASALATILL